MELKSDHFGIETCNTPHQSHIRRTLKSDHFGIETKEEIVNSILNSTKIRPFWD